MWNLFIGDAKVGTFSSQKEAYNMKGELIGEYSPSELSISIS